MNRIAVIAKLREHESEIRAAGVVRLSLFGSVARGDETPQSDIDLIAEFDGSKQYTLLTMGRLESRLADLLGTRVDLSSPDWMKEPVKRRALSEAIIAF
jgi:predicted nucleotidyltransferase